MSKRRNTLRERRKQNKEGRWRIRVSPLHSPFSFVFLCAACLLLAMTAACRKPAPQMQLELPTTEPAEPASVSSGMVVQLHVIGIRDAANGPKADFPAAGFRLADSGLVSTGRPRTAAGTEMTTEQLLAWLAELEARGMLVMYMNPSLSVQPGRATRVSNRHEMTYLANCEFYTDSRLSMKYEKAVSCTTLSVQSLEDRVSREPLLRIEVDMRAVALDWLPAAEAQPERHGSARSLRLALPRESFQRLSTVVPVRRDMSIVVAHFAKQSRPAQGSGITGQAIRDHILYIISAGGGGPRPERKGGSSESDARARCSADLVWLQWKDDRHPEKTGPEKAGASSAKAGASAARVGQAEVAEVLRRMKRAEDAVACSLGLTFARGHAVSFQIGENQPYIAGITPEPAADISGPYKFIINTIHAGMGLAVELNGSSPAGAMRFRPRLADAADFEEVAIEPSVRTLLPSFARTDHFSLARQAVAEGDISIPAMPDDILLLGLPWRRQGNGASAEVSKKNRIVLLGLRGTEQRAERALPVGPGAPGRAISPP